MNQLRIVVPAAPGSGEWLLLRNPVDVVTATTPDEVRPCLAAVEEGVASGLQAAGFVAYEAAPGFDSALQTRSWPDGPLVFFGLFEAAEPFALPDARRLEMPGCTWRPDLAPTDHAAAVAHIKDLLAAGETYQVNYTMRLRARMTGDPLEFFARMQAAQRSRYAAYIETDRFAVCSASPELFFELDGRRLVSRPMKGTARRGLSVAADAEAARRLERSEKDRAENVMIVDMIRNDMGRIATPGSVRVRRLCEREKYPTVWQLTSTVEATTGASVSEIFGALFPCASITGAPKVRTMEIIRTLEQAPRGVYCGSIGHVRPGRRAWFNVAIRTVMWQRPGGEAAYGVGGGIVWDSAAEDEYRECLTKAAVLTAEEPDFDLIETLLWEGDKGYFLAERHVDRLAASARYFDIALDPRAVWRALAKTGRALGRQAGRVRLLLSRSGRVRVEHAPLDVRKATPPRVLGVAARPIDASNRFLYHKTTMHPVRGRPLDTFWVPGRYGPRPPDDVLLWNERGEITESSIANVVVEKGGRRLTPPVASGLLPGVFRDRLLADGAIEEAVLTLEDVRRADALYLINSVRRWMPARLAAPDAAGPEE